MKQQDWTEQLRHRLSEYEEPVPEGLWDGIERRMQHRARMVALRRWVIGVAACGLLLIGGWQLFKKGQELPSPAGQLVAANTEEEQEQVVADGTPNETEVWDGAGSEGSNMLPAYHREHIEVHQATPQEETQVASQESSEEASQATSQEETQMPPVVPPSKERETMMPPASRDRPLNMQRKLRRISMQLHATNLLAQNGVTQIRPALLTRSFMETLSQDLSDRGPFYLANYEKRTEHNMPLTVGLSVSLPLTDRWWVASGVDFSRVTSTFTNKLNDMTTVNKQRLYYVGVPLTTGYSFWQTPVLQAYASVGAEAQYNIKVQVDNGYVDRDRLQFSALGSLGMAYTLLPQLSLYVQPGLRYYPDNGSHMQNIYKEHPWQFDLQLGVRFSLK